MDLEKWIAGELSHGVEVHYLFPCKYDKEKGGFGYEIAFVREEGKRIQHYTATLVRSNINQQSFLLSKVTKARYDKDDDEYVECPLLEGKQVRLNPKEPSTYAYEVSPFTITGTLILEDKLSWLRACLI